MFTIPDDLMRQSTQLSEALSTEKIAPESYCICIIRFNDLKITFTQVMMDIMNPMD